jgi:serine/threonine-protein kinase
MLSNLGEGRYKILEELGRGGMGVVYKCEDTLLGRIVAYKVLSSQIRDFPAALDNFLREAKSAARLNHPNIVTVYDFGESGDGYYMTLEYVPGRTLRQFMKSSPEPEKVRQVLAGICEGLAYAHSQNVVHRDIKPSNILVSDLDMKAKILDFGLAKVMEDVSQTASGVLGTPWYMSPEQVLGSQIDPRTDLYSLGVTLFEVFTGELPFRGRDFGYHHVHTPPPSPRSVSERVSEDLDRIILRCLQKKPDDRFQSAEAVRDAVLAARL